MTKETARNIAELLVMHGMEMTTEGNWIYDFDEIEDLFEIKLDAESLEMIMAAIAEREEVLDVWGPKETGENVIDINFGTDYYQHEDWDEEE